MKLKNSNSSNNIKKNRLTLSAMLNSDYLFDRSSKLKQALLNHKVIISNKFLTKRVHSKINTGRKRKIVLDLDSSQDSNGEIGPKDIPLELFNILYEYEKKFLNVNNKYLSIKEHNDAFLNFWHYIKKAKTRKEKDVLLKKYFPKDNNIINLYSDKIQKLSVNLFKSNPLITYNNYFEIFFHYLSEFIINTKDKEKKLRIKHKVLKFLDKLKDYLEYVEIQKDEDSACKDIKIKNSNYIKKLGTRINSEKLKMKDKKNIINNKIIEESKKMIDKTKNTLLALSENKNIFEEPRYFDSFYSSDYNKSIYFKKINISNLNKIRHFSPNQTGRITSRMSTAFYKSDNKNSLKNSNEGDKIISNENSYKDIFSHKEETNNILRHNSPDILDIKNRFISSIKNRRISILKKDKSNDIKSFDSDITSGRNSLYSSYKKEERNKFKKLTRATSDLFNLKKSEKRVSFFSPMANKNKKLQINAILNNRIKYVENDENNNSNLKEEKILNMKKKFYIKNYKNSIVPLYNEMHKKNKLKNKDIDKIKKYLTSKGKSINLNFNPIQIIKQAKRKTERIDIEKKTKKVFQPYLSYKQLEKLDNVKKINNNVYRLDFDYLSRIFDFQSKNSDSIQAYI